MLFEGVDLSDTRLHRCHQQIPVAGAGGRLRQSGAVFCRVDSCAAILIVEIAENAHERQRYGGRGRPMHGGDHEISPRGPQGYITRGDQGNIPNPNPGRLSLLPVPQIQNEFDLIDAVNGIGQTEIGIETEYIAVPAPGRGFHTGTGIIGLFLMGNIQCHGQGGIAVVRFPTHPKHAPMLGRDLQSRLQPGQDDGIMLARATVLEYRDLLAADRIPLHRYGHSRGISIDEPFHRCCMHVPRTRNAHGNDKENTHRLPEFRAVPGALGKGSFGRIGHALPTASPGVCSRSPLHFRRIHGIIFRRHAGGRYVAKIV